MRGPELQLVLLALVLCQAPRGPAAPVPVGEGTVLAKMYPRGNHWAVGHLMGKKSTGDSPSVPEGEGTAQLRGRMPWEDAARSLLGLLRAQGRRETWDSEDSSDLKDAGSKCKELGAWPSAFMVAGSVMDGPSAEPRSFVKPRPASLEGSFLFQCSTGYFFMPNGN